MWFNTRSRMDEDSLHVVGPTHLSAVDCRSFSAEGVTKVDDDIAAETVALKGSTSVGGDVRTDALEAKGTTNVGGSVEADEATFAGASRVEGSIQIDSLDAEGSSRFGDVEADSFVGKGSVAVDTLVADEIAIHGVVGADRLEADSIHLELGSGESEVDVIEASDLSVERNESDGRLTATTIVGEHVSIEHAIVEEVRAERVVIGPGANVGVVRAREFDVDDRATVERTERLD